MSMLLKYLGEGWRRAAAAAFAAALSLCFGSAFADDAVPTGDFTVLNGLGAVCDGTHVGQIGVSRWVNLAQNTYMVGALQITYVDGRDDGLGNPVCDKHFQVYSLKNRTPDLLTHHNITNTAISMKISPTDAENGTTLQCQGVCQWSTPFVGPKTVPSSYLTSDVEINENTVQFPTTAQSAIYIMAQPSVPYDNEVETAYLIRGIVSPKIGSNPDVNTVVITQIVKNYPSYTDSNGVYHPAKPYFDIVWEISSELYFDNIKFYYAADTYTSGVDFGYGYVCDINAFAGASGGSAFLQGLIGLNKSYKQIEHKWATVFAFLSKDSMPKYSSDPLFNDNPPQLTSLVDNAFALQWGCDPNRVKCTAPGVPDGCDGSPDDLQENALCGPGKRINLVADTPVYLAARWTFDDPIRSSTFGTAQALLTLNVDDKTLYDVHFDPTDWRGYIDAYQNPIKCLTDEDCQSLKPEGMTCMMQIEEALCSDTTKCPKYCAISKCNSDSDCNGEQFCLYHSYCTEKKFAMAGDLADGGNAGRVLFTFKPAGSYADFSSLSTDKTLISNEMGAADAAEGTKLMDWVRNYGLSSGDIIDDNDTVAENVIKTTKLRNRGGWTLGDITHAKPIYVGNSPLNPENSNFDKVRGKPSYKSYIDSDNYKNKRRILLVAANDGMLHAFDASEGPTLGKELWAFIPWGALPKMKELAKPYYEKLRTPVLDLTPVVSDVYDSVNNKWVTVIIVGMRGGGNWYYALQMDDDPSLPPHPLWSFTDPDLGLTYSKPAIARTLVQDDGVNPIVEKTVLVFGSGYAKTQAEQMTKKGFIYVVDLFDTEVIDGVKRPKLIRKFTASDEPNNVLTGAAVADEPDNDGNVNGFAEKAYIGDLYGNVYRIYFVPNGNNIDAEKSLLFSAERYEGETEDLVMHVYNTRECCTSWTYYPDGSKKDCEAWTTDCAATSQSFSYRKARRPISSAPLVAYTGKEKFLGNDENMNHVIVLFGTGKFDSFYDSIDKFVSNPDQAQSSWTHYYQYIFGIVDRAKLASRPAPNYVPNYDLDSFQHNCIYSNDINYRVIVKQDSSGNCDLPTEWTEEYWKSELSCVNEFSSEGDGCLGWSIKLESQAENLGERVVTDPVLLGKTMIATTFTPNGTGTCDIRGVGRVGGSGGGAAGGAGGGSPFGGGGGYLMAIDISSGGNPSTAILDKNYDGILGANDSYGHTNLAGMKFDGGILSAPVIDAVNGAIYFKAGTDLMPQQIHTQPQASFKEARTILYRIKY